MIFGEPAYFALLALAAVSHRFLPARVRPWWLFLFGIAFYAYFSPSFVAILLAETLLVFALGSVVRKNKGPAPFAFAVGVVACVGLLAFYKYAGLVTSTVGSAGVAGLPGFEDVRVPLAISFFTFEFIHYLADARKGTLPPHGMGDFLGFALFAPTLVAGPIKRFQGFADQAREARAGAGDIDAGVRRILLGLVKKVVIADTLTLWIGLLASTDAVDLATRGEIVTALVAYSFRIYFDFSGYSDIAIGSARLFGIRVPENFARPYLARDIGEFWRRWHISLMQWIRDYVYIPLGGSRCSMPRQVGNVLAAFAISGLWHGASWNFVAWGLYHGVLVAAHRVWTHRREDRPAGGRARRVVSAVAGTALTFSLVTLGWGLFAMPLSRFWLLLTRLAGGGM